MGSFDVLNDYKKKLKQMFLQDKELIKLIFYNDLNPLSQKDVLNPTVLFTSREVVEAGKTVIKEPCVIFGQKNFNTVTSESTFILIDFLVSRNHLYTYDDINMVIRIISHNKIINLSDNTNRAWEIQKHIDSFLNGNLYDFGVGEVMRNGWKPTPINDNFIGYTAIYDALEFGRNFDDGDM